MFSFQLNLQSDVYIYAIYFVSILFKQSKLSFEKLQKKTQKKLQTLL